MSLEIKNENGEFVPFQFADNSVKLDLEWALMDISNVEIQIRCYKCRKPIPAGTGSFCDKHHKK